MRRFYLVRLEDDSGISGRGLVAEGVLFRDGRVVCAWYTGGSGLSVYETYGKALATHGHGGKTRFHFVDGDRDAERLTDLRDQLEVEALTHRPAPKP